MPDLRCHFGTGDKFISNSLAPWFRRGEPYSGLKSARCFISASIPSQ